MGYPDDAGLGIECGQTNGQNDVKSRLDEIIGNLDNYDTFFWPRYRKLLAESNKCDESEMTYPSCLVAIRQIATMLKDTKTES